MAEEGPVASPSHNPTLGPCSDWVVISSPNGGLNAAADINHDEIVNAADIGLLVAAWGDAPRNPMPPSDCPRGLIPQPESRLAEEISSQFVRKIDRFAWAAQ